MRDPVILSAVRAPIGKFQGALKPLSATQLGSIVVRAAVERARLSPEQVDEVIMGNVLSAGVGQAPARQAMRHAGIPDGVHAMTINKVCGSGLKAIMLGPATGERSVTSAILTCAAQARGIFEGSVRTLAGWRSLAESNRSLHRERVAS